MPKLSVIVPVYNTEKYLRECVDSILSQAFTDLELILVDDGSTDGSGDICDEYCKLDNRVKVVHQENGGVTVARKQGTEIALGEYISFIDSDDWIDPNMYRDMLEKAAIHNADMVLCDMVVEKQDNATVIRSSTLSGFFASEELDQQIFSNMLFDFSKNAPGLSLNLCNKLIRTTLAKPIFAAFPSNVTYGEDTLGSLICILHSKSIFIMENCAFYHYRQTEEFFGRGISLTLLPRLSDFALNTQDHLSERSFNGIDQLSCYIAQVSLYCVRQILVFNKEYTLRNKLKQVENYFGKPHICELLKKSESLVNDKTMLRKIKLVNRKRFGFLFLLFYGKEMLLRIKRSFVSK